MVKFVEFKKILTIVADVDRFKRFFKLKSFSNSN